MRTSLRRWSAVGAAGLLVVVTGCVATGPGYGGDVGVAYVGDYYEPDGYAYGRWHPGYHVAPPRRGREAHPAIARPENRASSPVYRAAPSSHPAPSIPSRPRSR